MKEFIKNEKVLGLVRKAIQEKTITYEEINRELKDELPVDKIESLIEGMIDQGIDIIKEEDLKKHLEEHENDDLDDKKYEEFSGKSFMDDDDDFGDFDDLDLEDDDDIDLDSVDEISREDQRLLELFSTSDSVINRMKKVFYKKRFRKRLLDEIGYRFAFLLGKI